MSNTRVWTRNLLNLMTVSTSFTPATGFEATNTQSVLRSKFCRSPDATAQYFRWTLASGSFACSAIAMFFHRNHGGTWRVRGWTNTAWSGGAAFDTTVLPIYTAITTGKDWGYSDYVGADTHDPLGPETPAWAYFTPASGIKSVQLDLDTKSTTYGFPYWEIGYPFLANHIELDMAPYYGVAPGVGRGIGSPDGAERSGGGSLLAFPSAAWDLLDFTIARMSEDDAALMLDCMRFNRTSGGVVIDMYPDATGRKRRDGIVCGRLAALNDIGRHVGYLTNHVQLRGF